MRIGQPQTGIRLETPVQLNDQIDRIGVILYSGEGQSQVEEKLQSPLENTNDVTMIKQDECYWMVKKIDSDWSVNQEALQKLLGLTFTVICLELSNSIQTYVQRLFFHEQSQEKTIYSPRLICVKDAYKDQENTQQQQTLFWPSLASLQYVNDCLKIQAMKVAEVVLFFEYSDPRRVVQGKRIFDQYKMLQAQSNQPQIEEENGEQVENEMKAEVDSRSQDLSILSLQPSVSLTWLIQNQRLLIQNSLRRLKQLFWLIKGPTDTKAINFFRAEHDKMLSRLGSFIEIIPEVATHMEKELNRFMAYHEGILQGRSFSRLFYLRQEMVYKWKYDNIVFKKTGIFLGLLILAVSQSHFIPTITFLALALIAITLPY